MGVGELAGIADSHLALIGEIKIRVMVMHGTNRKRGAERRPDP